MLAAGTYRLIVDGTDANAFLANAHGGGAKMDGNFDGKAGGDYTTTFVEPTPTQANPTATQGVVVSIPDFVAGNGQAVHIPGDATTGIPVILTNVTGTDLTGVTSISIDFDFDGALLAGTTGASRTRPDPSINAGTFTFSAESSAAFASNWKSFVSFTYTNSTGLTIPANSSITLAYLTASVPSTAIYGAKEVIQPNRITILKGSTNIPATDSTAVHLAACRVTSTTTSSVGIVDKIKVNLAASSSPRSSSFNDTDPLLVDDLSRAMARSTSPT